MRRRLLAGVALAAVATVGVVQAAGGESAPQAPIPRVCWFSDYEKGGLSNRCEYREDERRWYMEAKGRMVPADTQRLPVANLCLYFHGTKCPDRNERSRKGGPR